MSTFVLMYFFVLFCTFVLCNLFGLSLRTSMQNFRLLAQKLSELCSILFSAPSLLRPVNSDTSSSKKCEGRSKQLPVNPFAMILSPNSLRKHHFRNKLESIVVAGGTCNNDALKISTTMLSIVMKASLLLKVTSQMRSIIKPNMQ